LSCRLIRGVAHTSITAAEAKVLRRLDQLSNVVPVLGKTDTLTDEQTQDVRSALKGSFRRAGFNPFTFDLPGEGPQETLHAVSSMLKDDSDIMDASLLMSPDYSPPLVPSDLSNLVHQLFEPDSIERLRHCAVKKFLQWRRDHASYSLQAHKNELQALPLRRLSAAFDNETAGFMRALDTPPAASFESGPLAVPGGPPPSWIADPGMRTGAVETGLDTDFSSTVKSCSQMHIAGWAVDLQRALGNERSRLGRRNDPKEMAMCRTHNPNESPRRRGRKSATRQYADAGLDVAYGPMTTNTQDPLGILTFAEEFTRRGLFALQVVGGCSILATAAVWMMRNWETVRGLFSFHNSVQAQTYGGTDGREWREGFWSGRW